VPLVTSGRFIGHGSSSVAGQIYVFDWQGHPVSTKAPRELTSLDVGLRETLVSLGLL
jgi:hypothetical protein